MSEFHKTLMGKKFYERDVPKIVRALEKIAQLLEEQKEKKNEQPE